MTDAKKKVPFPKRGLLAMAFLAAALPFAVQHSPFNGSMPPSVWEQKAREALAPEMKHRHQTENPVLVSIEPRFGGNEGAFAKMQVKFSIPRTNNNSTEMGLHDLIVHPGDPKNKGTEEVVVPCTQQTANGGITCGNRSTIMFTEPLSSNEKNLPDVLKICGFDAINPDGSLKKTCPPPVRLG